MTKANAGSDLSAIQQGNKWWAWKDLHLRPADYESGDLVVLTGETPRILRGFLMHISDSFETRAYPETRRSFSIENEPEFMASLSQRASPGNKSRLIEPEPAPKSFRKFTFGRSRQLQCALEPTG